MTHSFTCFFIMCFMPEVEVKESYTCSLHLVAWQVYDRMRRHVRPTICQVLMAVRQIRWRKIACDILQNWNYSNVCPHTVTWSLSNSLSRRHHQQIIKTDYQTWSSKQTPACTGMQCHWNLSTVCSVVTFACIHQWLPVELFFFCFFSISIIGHQLLLAMLHCMTKQWFPIATLMDTQK